MRTHSRVRNARESAYVCARVCVCVCARVCVNVCVLACATAHVRVYALVRATRDHQTLEVSCGWRRGNYCHSICAWQADVNESDGYQTQLAIQHVRAKTLANFAVAVLCDYG